jgi:hypothetical protein
LTNLATSAFAALKNTGQVSTWGSTNFGGDSSAVSSQLSSGVVSISTTAAAFAAVKADGTVVCWYVFVFTDIISS